MIEFGNVKNKSELIRKLGTYRSRVYRYIKLLNLEDSVIKAIEQLGDPMPKRIITERHLRHYTTKAPTEQQKIIKLLKIER